MKKTNKILALISSVTIISNLIFGGVTVSAEETEYEPPALTVTAVSGSDSNKRYYLTNGCALSQNEFQEYSGETFELQYGDVIKVYHSGILEIYPGMFAWSEGGTESKIEYVGKVADYYETKELTVTDKTQYGDKVTFTDDSGTEYIWGRNGNNYNNPAGIEELGFDIPDEFDPALMKTGQKFNCAVSKETYYYSEKESFERDCVIIPISAAGNSGTASKPSEAKTQINISWNKELSNKCYRNTDYTINVAIGYYRKDFGEFTDLIYYGNSVDKENYTISRNGNESISITLNEDYLKTLPTGNCLLTLEFEKAILTNGIAFTIVIPEKGDVNSDGSINLYDIIRIAEHMTGKKTLNESEMALADFNEDGKVNLYDAIKIAEYLLKH